MTDYYNVGTDYSRVDNMDDEVDNQEKCSKWSWSMILMWLIVIIIIVIILWWIYRTYLSNVKYKIVPSQGNWSRYNDHLRGVNSNNNSNNSSSSNNNTSNNASWTAAGCYNDYSNCRQLPNQANGYYTVQGCANVAQAAGATYFAMQYPQGTNTLNEAQCFYGNSLPLTTPSTCSNSGATYSGASCNIVDSNGWALGDSNINSVYRLTNSNNSNTSNNNNNNSNNTNNNNNNNNGNNMHNGLSNNNNNNTNSNNTSNSSNYSFVNCYNDHSYSRALNANSNGANDYQTVDGCYAEACLNGYKYFGMQNPETTNNGQLTGRAQCFYGNSGYATYGQASCSSRDNNNNYLGGSSVNAVYQINNTSQCSSNNNNNNN